QGLSSMPLTQIPAPLRKSASFAPSKRTKLVGKQIADAVEGDAVFREHLATQVRAGAADLARLLESDEAVSDADLPEVAALAYILRPDGWEDCVDRATAQTLAEVPASAGERTPSEQKLQADLKQARGEVKAVRDKLKGQLEQVKADNTQLRRTLGHTRVQLKEAQQAAEEARAESDAVRRDAEAAAREADAEQRRLRQRVEQLESENTASRRAQRDDRDAENMRLRLLLDTIMESASGLRRELALPPSEVLPADTVPAVEPGVISHAAGIGRSLLNDDPVLLRRLLEVPRSHLIVDGYNVSKTAWPTAPLDQQRSRLTSSLAALVGGKGIETTIVFDGADLAHPPGVTSPRGIRVRFSPAGVIADDLIRQLVSAEPMGRSVIVVSTDREVAKSVAKMGARSVASAALIKAMGL
ncbi:MAG TPA: NYN domain-containing protein, partial [Nocardioidaceae bacterium]